MHLLINHRPQVALGYGRDGLVLSSMPGIAANADHCHRRCTEAESRGIKSRHIRNW